MSVELVNRFCIKKDGVYINTHSNNDTAPFHSVRLNRISETYLHRGSGVLSRWSALKEFVWEFSWYSSLRLHGNDERITALNSAIRKAQDEIAGKYDYDKLDDYVKGLCGLNKYERRNLIENLHKTLDKTIYEKAAKIYLFNGGDKTWKIDIAELKEYFADGFFSGVQDETL